MKTINRNALVPYSAAEMFALVDDIESYQDFLPWCSSSKVLSRDEDLVRGAIRLSKGGIEKSFTTANRIQKNKMIEMRLEEGPFHHLEGFWHFDALDEQACKISLLMEFEFSSKLLGLTIGPVFNQIANSMVDAFVKRAADVYGKR
ncbi:cyclase [Candidatus Tenderia electrophaga]|jgi:ribosome-associated toxin RatA of RatAB toxin-antitoxin module|uniref:Cyclase n=1 Tax=Candidatus Tenderia electrophaga TaxID=1748243 RepID=A0A0S2TC80_9GAMM|nr:cyclase [Candidatus Tenderia electrophaga]